MGPFNGPTIAILVILALLLFGAKKLPDLARSLGRSARILKAESKGLVDEDDETKGASTHTQQTQPSQQTPPSQQHSSGPADAHPQTSPQLPPGERIVNEAGESTHHTHGNRSRTPSRPGRTASGETAHPTPCEKVLSRYGRGAVSAAP